MEWTICIIDDDMVSQFASKYCIEQSNANCRVITCDDAAAGLDLFANLQNKGQDLPDILLLDLVMQEQDGWEFLEKLKDIIDGPLKTDIYILSAFTNSKDRARAKEHPMIQGYFDKPLSKSNMEKVLHSKMA